MKHKDIIEKMTLEEKAAFLSGKGEWETRNLDWLGIPSITCSDGPHGLRRQAGTGDHLGLNPSLPAVCFPSAAGIANSWDEALGEEIGAALGEEARSQDVQILLGPGLNIKRSPLCGRNFEYFSEDPYLSGKMAAAYIRGIQKNGVYACPKHFAVNNQELRRMAMNSVVDERTLREIYLTGFEIAVKEGHAKAIMSSYNEVNGAYANENPHLLKEILREDWGFDGIVITDWGASNSHTAGVQAGSDLEMPCPGLDSARELVDAVAAGKLDEADVDACVDRLLDAVLYLTGQEGIGNPVFPDMDEHHALAKRAAEESIVLLKNEDAILPLAPKTKIAVIGDFAFEPRYQGAGSSMVNAVHVEKIKDQLEVYFPEYTNCVRGYRRDGKPDEEGRQAALQAAKNAEVVLFFLGLTEISEAEGQDRKHMRLPDNQTALLEELAQANPNIIGILSGGSVVEMPWLGCCKALLHGYLGGEAGAGAMLEVLSGKVSPSGKLSETYPIRYEQTPAFQNFLEEGRLGKGNAGREKETDNSEISRNTEYREGIYVGYRYYDKLQSAKNVLFPFGYGLSYTGFAYSDFKVTETEATFTVENTGGFDGAEIAQLYVGLPDSRIFRPEKELKGFARVFLKAGERKKVTILFDDKTFRYWNTRTNHWERESGNYRICIGASSQDIRLEDTLAISGSTELFPEGQEELPSYYSGKIQKVSRTEFEQLLGHPVPEEKQDGLLSLNDPVSRMSRAKSPLARFVCRRLEGMIRKKEEQGTPDLNLLFIYNIPFRAIAKMTHGAVSMEMAEGMVTMANGHFFRGAGKVIGGFFRNRRLNREYEKKLAMDAPEV